MKIKSFLVCMILVLTLSFNCFADDIIFKFTLVNASTNKDILELDENDTNNLTDSGEALNIRADIQDADIQKDTDHVQFQLDGANFRTEKFVPYALAGDIDGDYQSWTPSIDDKTHTLKATAFDSSGDVVAEQTVSFTVSKKGNNQSSSENNQFSSEKDLISLHHDHCADPDDGHATVANRTLTAYYGITPHVVSGTYGWQTEDPKKDIAYQSESKEVMKAAWGDDWLNAHEDWDGSVNTTAEIWSETIDKGGHIWIAEGGQSDFTADVVRRLHKDYEYSQETTRSRIHLVQHSTWNENYTTDEDLKYVKKNTNYIKIDDGNSGGNHTAGLMLKYNTENSAIVDNFIRQAKNSEYSDIWEAAFAYLDPTSDQWGPDCQKLDFSDTVELLYILGIEKSTVADCSEFANTFLKAAEKR